MITKCPSNSINVYCRYGNKVLLKKQIEFKRSVTNTYYALTNLNYEKKSSFFGETEKSKSPFKIN